MFLRSSVVKKSGKTYRYWKLVENVRTDAGPRQQVVAHFETFPISPQPTGRLSPDEWASRKWPPLSNAGSGRAVARAVPPSGPSRIARPLPPDSDVISIRLSETTWREPVAFGDVYTALVLWKRLGLGELLSERMNGSA